jgi:hypothetical protein
MAFSKRTVIIVARADTIRRSISASVDASTLVPLPAGTRPLGIGASLVCGRPLPSQAAARGRGRAGRHDHRALNVISRVLAASPRVLRMSP